MYRKGERNQRGLTLPFQERGELIMETRNLLFSDARGELKRSVNAAYADSLGNLPIVVSERPLGVRLSLRLEPRTLASY